MVVIEVEVYWKDEVKVAADSEYEVKAGACWKVEAEMGADSEDEVDLRMPLKKWLKPMQLRIASGQGMLIWLAWSTGAAQLSHQSIDRGIVDVDRALPVIADRAGSITTVSRGMVTHEALHEQA